MAFDESRSQRLSGNHLELSIQDRSGKVQNFYAVEKDIVDAMKQAMRLCAADTAEIAFELCAFDTGFMRDHIKVIESENFQTFEVGWEAWDFYDAGFDFYPMYVVLGTRFQPPNDPLTPAYEQTKPRYEQRMRELVGAALDNRRAA